MQPDAFDRRLRPLDDQPGTSPGQYQPRPKQVSPDRRIATLLPRFAVAPTLTVLLFAVAIGCSPAPADPQPRPLSLPIVEESYAVDDQNRPLTQEELDAVFAQLQSDEAAFLAELEEAPPVRQASLIFVLQRSPAAAREHRDLLERLSASPHGIVRRAALFALEAAEEVPAAP